MTRQQKRAMIQKMKEVVSYIRDAQINANALYTAEMIRHNMNETFCGLQFAMDLMTGLEWHYSNAEGNWAVVSIDKTDWRNPKETRYAL